MSSWESLLQFINTLMERYTVSNQKYTFCFTLRFQVNIEKCWPIEIDSFYNGNQSDEHFWGFNQIIEYPEAVFLQYYLY